MIALGLFANGVYGDGLNGVAGGVRGLFYGDPGQLFAEIIGMLVNIGYVAIIGAVAFILIGKLVGNRVSLEDEMSGLDVAEMGLMGYCDDSRPIQ